MTVSSQPVFLRPRRFGDARGWFMETYSEASALAAGIDAKFVQDNQSFSAFGVRLRLASTLREAGELTAAIQVLRDAAKSRPEKSRIHFSLAEVLDEAGFEA